MTSARYRAPASRTAAELVLLAAVVAGFAAVVRNVVVEGYLPQPFIWDTNDTFMDWFNTAYWANRPGAYSVWRTVYPPLSFVFLRVFSLPRCYLSASFVARDCDHVGQAAILGFYALGMILAYRAFRRRDPRTAAIRAIALTLSYPALFVLERGNLIIPCFCCFVLAHGGLARSRWTRALAMAVTINFKPYLLVPVLALGVQRRWPMLERAGFATIGLYLLSYGIFGAGSLGELIDNTRNWVTFTEGSPLGQVYQTTSFQPFFGVIDRGFPILLYTDSGTVDFWMTTAHVYMRSVQLLGVVALAGAWLQPQALSLPRVTLLLLALFLTQNSPGGYTEVFVLFLLFLEPLRRPGPIVALVAGYLLAVPYEYQFAHLPDVRSISWLTDRNVLARFGIGMGQFLRPALLLLIVAALSIDSILIVWRAHRRHRPSFGLASRGGGAPAAMGT